MKILQKILKKSRGISPVIATVLLIGLVIVAGVAVALVLFGTINTPIPLKIEVLSISNFETTDDDSLIDQFSVTLHNTGRKNGLILADSFEIFRDLDEPNLDGWEINLTNTQILLPALEIQTIPLHCDVSIDESELIPNTGSLYIEVTVYPEGSTNPRNARTFRSDVLMVGNTYGPVSLTVTTESALFDDSGINLSFTAYNLGSRELDLYLELSTTNSQSISFTSNGENTTRYDFSISPNATFSQQNFTTIYPTALAITDENFIIIITLWDQSSFRLLASSSLLLTYTG